MAKAKSVKRPRSAKNAVAATANAKRAARSNAVGTAAGETKPKKRVAAKAARPGGRSKRKRLETLRLHAFSPGLTVADLEKSLEFYSEGLGFVVSQRWMHEGSLVGAFVTAGECELGLGQDDWAKGRRRKKGEGVRIWCETAQDIDAIAARVRAYGGKITEEPADHAWGVRAFSVDDPDGYHLTFFKPAPAR